MNPELITSISDEALFEEVASRLKRLYRKQHGLEFLFGCFEFVFHQGRFQGIEDRPRYKRYRSPERLNAITSAQFTNEIKRGEAL